MNEPYSPWHQRNPAGEQPLAARYTGSEPILWNGSMVYPMYTDRIGTEPILLYMTLLSQAPPAGLRGHGLGLSVLHGYIELEGHKLTGVDIWSDALARGVTVELVPTGANAVFSLTPVWVDQTGAHRSWTGNYGMLVEDIPNDIVALWCSLGEGPPNFANLVVGVGIAPVRPGTRESGRAATDPGETPAATASLDSPAESGERPDQTTGESPDASEWMSPEAYAEPAPAEPAPAEPAYADTPYADSAYTDDRLTDSRVPKERQVRRGETTPPTEPTPPFVDENATMTMKYTPPPWGAAPARPEPRPASEPAPARLTDPRPEPVWEAPPEPAHGGHAAASPEPAGLPEPIPSLPTSSLSIPSFDELWESAGSSTTDATETAPEPAWESAPAPAADPVRTHEVAWASTSASVAEIAPESEQAWSSTTDTAAEPAPAHGTAQADDPGAAYRNALYDLGTGMYDRGEEEQACGLWAQAAEAGHAGAAHDLAVLLFRRGEHTAAEGWWRVAAQHGESRSMALLAELLDRRGDSTEAARWRVRAAEADRALHS